MSFRNHIRLFLSWLTSVYFLALGTTAQAAELALADGPLFLGTQIDPNVFFMMDDSGSMDWEILTRDYHPFSDYWSSSSTVGLRTDGNWRVYSDNGLCTGTRTYYYIYSRDSGNTDNTYDSSCDREAMIDQPNSTVFDWRIRSADFNVLYYDPRVNYSPWIGFSDANFSSARSNPDNDTDGYSVTRNLTGFIYELAIDDHGVDLDSQGEVEGPTTANDTPNDMVDIWDSHTKYELAASQININAYTVPPAVDAFGSGFTNGNCTTSEAKAAIPLSGCFGTTEATSTVSGASLNEWGRTVNQEKQNVANWYQYSRKRSYVAKGAVSLVVTSNPSFRFGLSQINDYDDVFVEVPDIALDDYIAHNTALLDAMTSWEWESQGTPLRRGLERVGRYYDNYYGSYADPIVSECQQNYSVLFTDGYWGGSSPYTAAIGDEDGDGQSDTVADIAHYFYTEDLSPLDDEVPQTSIDPAEHQHMVSFTVAFGVEGNLVDTDDDGYPNPELAEDGAWTSGSLNTNSEKI